MPLLLSAPSAPAQKRNNHHSVLPLAARFFTGGTMKIRKPAYFDDFRCLAGACPDSCCKEWDVLVDEESAARYLSLDGALGDALRKVMYEEDGQYYFAIQADRRCPMWRNDGLCRIQAEAGEGALCNVCRDFPRLTHDFGDFMERGLELSCPEAARIILSAPTAPWVTEETPGGEAEYDVEAMTALLKIRDEALAILEDRRYTPAQALALLLIHGYRSQEVLDGGDEEPFDPAAALELAAELACQNDGADIIDFFLGLEILTPAWKQRLENGWQAVEISELCLPLARYFVERYYLQAVSDYDLVGRVKLAVISCLLITSLGGDFVETAQLYSKEIENDADNVEAILDGAYSSPALTDAKLLGLLLK